ncbi:hypothetical protein ACFSMW_08225 [Virgibacillus halophilus]|uniref:hypothetical protein n=1 Tax=Tigheibacillus halophilus TaxID=361280 RepID=UPI003642F78E
MKEGKLHTVFAANACTPLVGAPGVQINEIAKLDKKVGRFHVKMVPLDFFTFPGVLSHPLDTKWIHRKILGSNDVHLA